MCAALSQVIAIYLLKHFREYFTTLRKTQRRLLENVPLKQQEYETMNVSHNLKLYHVLVKVYNVMCCILTISELKINI